MAGSVRIPAMPERSLSQLNTPTLTKINHNTHHPNPQGENKNTPNHSIRLKTSTKREDAPTNGKIKDSKSKANQ
jgi:hypothetical protein